MEATVRNNSMENTENNGTAFTIYPEVAQALDYLNHEETFRYFDDLLLDVERKAIDDVDAFDEEEALEIIRGMHLLRKTLRKLCPVAAFIPVRDV
ncbi:MAG: hypothetical protein HDS62_08235 [Bacteroidales bacterium]|nr:hypothetical protein [Bacteroidales bacterium]